jgi:hypothetical protein
MEKSEVKDRKSLKKLAFWMGVNFEVGQSLFEDEGH